MRIALVDSTRKPTAYPVGLLKIGAWLKERGDTVKLLTNALPRKGAVDEVWIGTTFTFDIPHAISIVRAAKEIAKKVRVGGVAATLLPVYFEREGVEVHRGLIPEAEAHAPDYSLLPKPPEYSVTHTSRGCVRRCGFCMVTRLEPKYAKRPHWERDLAEGVGAVRFYDNNWLAKPRSALEDDIAALKRLVRAGSVTSIDFNQGLDCRLMKPWIADALEGLPISPVRFAFDNMGEDGHYQRAVEAMAKKGFRVFRTYVLYNYDDTPEEFYYRLRTGNDLAQNLHVALQSFPMRYQPILEVRSRAYVGSHWTARRVSGFHAIIARHSIAGIVSCSAPFEFDYWFGRDAEEFVRLLDYPGIVKLCHRKLGRLRQDRSILETGKW